MLRICEFTFRSLAAPPGADYAKGPSRTGWAFYKTHYADLECELLLEVALQLIDRNTLLCHGITLTDGDTVIRL